MRHCIFLAAVAAVGLWATAPSARAADTVLLGGIGSSAARSAVDAPAMTLKGLPTEDATLQKAHWGYYRPWFRPYWGYGFYRPWFRPWFGYGFYRPWFYRPWFGTGFYQPWFSYGWSQPWYGISYAYAPTISVDYAPVGYVETVPTSLTVTQQGVPAASVWPPAGRESLPTPGQPGGFRYDGGPLRPVPPAGVSPPPPVDESLSGSRSAPTRVVSQPKSRLTYPAYGEPPAKPSVQTNSLRVNTTRR